MSSKFLNFLKDGLSRKGTAYINKDGIWFVKGALISEMGIPMNMKMSFLKNYINKEKDLEISEDELKFLIENVEISLNKESLFKNI